MKYDFDSIGSRIAKERKEAGFKSQQAFIDYLHQNYEFPIGRNTLSAIENGNARNYDCELLYIMCEIFDCEIGYLLCEYEFKKRQIEEIEKRAYNQALEDFKISVYESLEITKPKNAKYLSICTVEFMKNWLSNLIDTYRENYIK